MALLGASGALMSGGIFIASQKATTGNADWGEVGKESAIDAVTGMVGGGAGGAISRIGATAGKRVLYGALGGGADGFVNGTVNYATSPGPHTMMGAVQTIGSSTVVGAATGGTVAGGPKWLDVADTKKFSGWSYRMGHVDESTVLHRSGDLGGRHTGNWWSTDRPMSVARVRQDKALPETWPTGDASVQNGGFTAQFDQKMPAYRGFAAPQRDLDGTVYRGGGNQTYVPDGWSHAHVTNSWPLAP